MSLKQIVLRNEQQYFQPFVQSGLENFTHDMLLQQKYKNSALSTFSHSLLINLKTDND